MRRPVNFRLAYWRTVTRPARIAVIAALIVAAMLAAPEAVPPLARVDLEPSQASATRAVATVAAAPRPAPGIGLGRSVSA